jgi:choline dehydrogenase-like flavoprotein
MIESKKAVGAVFIKNGRKHIVRANLEVVVSGGSVSSPQILLLSGIGPNLRCKWLRIIIR